MANKEALIQFAERLDNPWFVFGFAVLVVWTAVWKGLALWRAARNSQPAWFVVMLVLNTAGILEIIYFFVFGKKKAETPQQ